MDPVSKNLELIKSALIKSSMSAEGTNETQDLVRIIDKVTYKMDTNENFLQDVAKISHLSLIPLSSILSAKLCQTTIQEQIQYSTTLPRTYLKEEQQLSSHRGIQNILKFMDTEIGWQIGEASLRDCKLTKVTLAQAKKYVSSKIPHLIFQSLARYGVSPEHFYDMGRGTSSFIPQKTIQEIRQEKTSTKLIDKLILDIIPKYFDKFFYYEQTSDSSEKGGIVIKITLSKQAQEVFGSQPPISTELIMYIMGAFHGVTEKASQSQHLLEVLEVSPKKGGSFRLQTSSLP
jgi:hypothetical protein